MPFVAAIPAIAAGVSAAAGVAKTIVSGVQAKKAREAALKSTPQQQSNIDIGNALNGTAKVLSQAPAIVKSVSGIVDSLSEAKSGIGTTPIASIADGMGSIFSA